MCFLKTSLVTGHTTKVVTVEYCGRYLLACLCLQPDFVDFVAHAQMRSQSCIDVVEIRMRGELKMGVDVPLPL